MIRNMFDDLMNRNVRIEVAFNDVQQFYESATTIPAKYTGIVTGYSLNHDDHFIILNGKMYISTKYIQTIEVLN